MSAAPMHGLWPRDRLIAMDERALAAMMREHPNRTPRELRKVPPRPAPVVALLPVPPVPPEFAVLNAAIPELAGKRDDCLLIAKQIALLLLSESYGEEVAARAFDTIIETAKAARLRIAPVIAMHALKIEPTLECMAEIFEICTGGRGLQWSRKDLIRLVSAEFKVSIQDMVSARRTKAVVYPRHAAMYLCKRFTASSYPDIGRAFGKRDHTSAFYAVNKLERIVQERSVDCGDDPVMWAKELFRIAPQVMRA